MDFLKSTAGKVVSGITFLAVIALGISWYSLEAATRESILGGTGKIFGWLMIVLLVPWATFFIIRWVASFRSNLTGGILVFIYSALELAALGWIFDWSIVGKGAWTACVVGALFAIVYNVLTCDWIAEKLEG
jgi:hypothetical protein